MKQLLQQYPALPYSLAITYAIYAALNSTPLLLIPLTLFFLVPHLRKIFVIALLIFVYIATSYKAPHLDEPAQGRATITFSKSVIKKHFFGQKTVFYGTLNSFETPSLIAKNIPIQVIKPSTLQPELGATYQTIGTLAQNKQTSYTFTPDSNNKWKLVKKNFTFEPYRTNWKRSVKNFITHHYKTSTVKEFLSGLSTGEFDAKDLKQAFSRFGLQHIMAISGFHFALVAGFIHFFLQIFIPGRKGVCLLIFLLSSYFLFLGLTPSVLRAWICITLALIAGFFQRESRPLNTLCIAVILMLLINPFFLFQLGFQFSVLITAAILLLFRPLDQMLETYLPKRDLSTLLLMSSFEQHLYIAAGFIRQGLALTFSVNSVALPLTLFYFGKFPCLGLLYNLFFPFLVSFSMFILFFGALLSPISPLGTTLHALNNFYTKCILNFTLNLPTTLDYTWRTAYFPLWALILYLLTLFFFALYVNTRTDTRNQLIFLLM